MTKTLCFSTLGVRSRLSRGWQTIAPSLLGFVQMEDIRIDHFDSHKSALCAEDEAILRENPLFNKHGAASEPQCRNWREVVDATRFPLAASTRAMCHASLVCSRSSRASSWRSPQSITRIPNGSARVLNNEHVSAFERSLP